MIEKHIDLFIEDECVGHIIVCIEHKHANEIGTSENIGEQLEAFLTRLITNNSAKNKLQ